MRPINNHAARTSKKTKHSESPVLQGLSRPGEALLAGSTNQGPPVIPPTILTFCLCLALQMGVVFFWGPRNWSGFPNARVRGSGHLEGSCSLGWAFVQNEQSGQSTQYYNSLTQQDCQSGILKAPPSWMRLYCARIVVQNSGICELRILCFANMGDPGMTKHGLKKGKPTGQKVDSLWASESAVKLTNHGQIETWTLT